MLNVRADDRVSPSPARLYQLPEEAWPFYSPDEIDAVTQVLRSGRVNQWTGDRVWSFEKAYAAYLGCQYTIALANGSVALELALRAFGIGPGDEVVVTPRSFVASAFCVMLVGARPVFADVSPESGNLTPESISAVLGPRTRAIIPVHLAGWPAEMPAIMSLAKERGLLVIEDCAQAHGASIGGQPVGSFGDAAAFSFCQDKIITTGGEGGLVAFKDPEIHRRAWAFKDHGKNPDKAFAPSPTPGFRWLHDEVGTNWRMTEICAAIGLLQLAKLPRWREARERRARIWAEAFADIDGLDVPLPPSGVEGAFYKFYAYIHPDRGGGEVRDAILAEAKDAGIKLLSGSCSEIYLEEAFREMDQPRLEMARRLGETSLMMEVHPTLEEDRVRDRAQAIADIVRRSLY